MIVGDPDVMRTMRGLVAFAGQHWRRTTVLAAIAVVPLLAIASCRREFVMPSLGMEPTIKMGSRFEIEPFDEADRARVTRGDIVVFRLPGERDKTQVRRIVALGGDSVEIRAKHLLVNGIEPVEPYVVHSDPEVSVARDQMTARQVRPGTVFLLGDNRDNSNDGRFWGDVPIEDLVGRLR